MILLSLGFSYKTWIPDMEKIVLLKEKHLEIPVQGEGIKKQLDIWFFEWDAVNGA